VKVIPAIDLRDGQCVRLFQGDFGRQTGYTHEPVELAHQYETMGFDTLHIVDLDGARTGQPKNQEIVCDIVETTGLTVQLGGGLRSDSQVDRWLSAGLARVVIGSLAITEPGRVAGWLADFGAERIVLALDVNVDTSGVPRIATHGWQRGGAMALWQCIEDYLAIGLKHVLCTDISRDGAMTGPNLDLYRELIRRYPEIGLQASGGVRSINDLMVLRQTGARGAITGRALLDGKITTEEVATFLRAA